MKTVLCNSRDEVMFAKVVANCWAGVGLLVGVEGHVCC